VKSQSRNTKRSGRREAPRISLFPFLAVLICTMGALVLLLLAVTRQARLQAIHAAREEKAKRQEDVTADREAAEWRLKALRKSRQETESQLADARLVLGHVEDHTRRLGERLTQLAETARAAEQSQSETRRRSRSVQEDELGRIERQLTEAQQHLAEAQQAARKRPHSYAVIPYEGPNQTRRRPIYLECRADDIVLQPENIAFCEDDFDGPQGPGNPLAAALRAAREYLLAQGGFDSQNGGEPYPLLLVRPSGTAAYYAAREAMKSWASDFGYELIGDDWKLQFPPADPGLASVLRQTVQSARLEQQRLIAAAPSRYGKRVTGAAGYGSSSFGADDADTGPGEEGGGGFYAQRPTGRYANPYLQVSTGAAAPGGPAGGPANGVPGGAAGGGVAGGGVAGGGVAGGGVAGGGVAGGAPGGAPGFPIPNPQSPIPSGTPGGVAPAGVAGGAAGGGVPGLPVPNPQSPIPSGASGGVARPDGYVIGRPAGDPPPPQRPADPDASAPAGPPGIPLRPGEWHPPEDAPPPKRPDDDKKQEKKVKHIDKRGDDWALRKAAEASFPITRPIHLNCYPDRLVLVSEAGGGEATSIPISAGTQQAIDPLITAIWEQMDSWGMAGKSMYWRPLLSVYVAPGAEQRFDDLQRLLQGSGLTVQKKL
jgi:hypothetical protein